MRNIEDLKQIPVKNDDFSDKALIDRTWNGMIGCFNGAQKLLDKDPSPEVAQELKDVLKAATLGIKKIDQYSYRELSQEDRKALVALSQGLWDKFHAIKANTIL